MELSSCKEKFESDRYAMEENKRVGTLKNSIFTKSKYNLKNSFRFKFHFFQHNFFRSSVQFIFFKTGDAAFENVLRGDPSRELDSKFGTGALSSADTKPGADSSASADV